MDKIKALIEEAQEEGLLTVHSWQYYDKNPPHRSQGYSPLKIAKAVEIFKKIKDIAKDCET